MDAVQNKEELIQKYDEKLKNITSDSSIDSADRISMTKYYNNKIHITRLGIQLDKLRAAQGKVRTPEESDKLKQMVDKIEQTIGQIESRTSLNEIIHEEILGMEEDYERRKREHGRQPRVGREFKYRGTTYAKSRESGDETHKMREKITKYVYQARDLIRKNFGITPPKITYRVVDWTPNDVLNKDRTLGCATGFGTRVILIPAKTINSERFGSDAYLKHIIFHEILHATYCVEHDDGSPLMRPSVPSIPLSDSEIDGLFVKHIKDSGNSHLSDDTYRRR